MDESTIKGVYGNRLRLRVCGLLENDDSLLMVKHRFGSEGELWIPPGGEVHFSEKAEQALKREFMEETGLKVTVGNLAFVYEYIDKPFHAIELFYYITGYDGDLVTGTDPETEEQLIEEVAFLNYEKIDLINKNKLHGIFSQVASAKQIFDLSGFLPSTLI